MKNFMETVENVRRQLANVNVSKLGYSEIREFHKIMKIIEGEKDFPLNENETSNICDVIANQIIFEIITKDFIETLKSQNIIGAY